MAAAVGSSSVMSFSGGCRKGLHAVVMVKGAAGRGGSATVPFPAWEEADAVAGLGTGGCCRSVPL
eukprot:7345091-Alexandrium_andersonii.AAC.1